MADVPTRSTEEEEEANARRRAFSMAAAQEQRKFRIKVALVWLGIFIVATAFLSMAQFDWGWMRDKAPEILKGAWVTLYVSACSIILAIILAVLGSLARLSRNPVAYGISGFYTSFFRGTPLIVQLYLWYFAIPQVVLNVVDKFNLPASFYRASVMTAVVAGILGLGFNYGAYMTEIFRAGILAVGPGQTEAAAALGMTYGQRMRRVVLPQAFKIIVPPTANEFIAMTKDTALIGFLGSTLFWYDPFTYGRTLGTLDSRFIEGLLVAASAYWILTGILTYFQTKLERKLAKAYSRTGAGAGDTAPAPSRSQRWLSGAGGGKPKVAGPEDLPIGGDH
jgi:polar amino acid transport system permease protein